MRTSPLLRHPLHGISALCCLLASHAGATHPDNPPITDCLCPDEVQILSEHDPAGQGKYKLKASVNGTFEIEVMAVPPSQGNPHTPKMILRDEHGKEIDSKEAWQHTFTFPAVGLESPITLEVTVPCGEYGPKGKICDTKTFVFGCDADDCGTGGTCQSGTGSPHGDVDPGSGEPFGFSLSIGSNSHGDETTGLHFNVSPDSPIGLNDFNIHSNGGYAKNGNTIVTGTTETTLSEDNGVVTVGIKKIGDTAPFKTYQFTSDTTAKTLTLVETSCGQAPVTHQWKKQSGTFSFSEAGGMRVKTATIVRTGDFFRIERHIIKEQVGGTEVTVSDVRLHFNVHPWGERLIQRQIDPTGANLLSTWTYGGPSDGAAYGKLMHHTRHDGHAETHSYGTGYHQIDYAGGRQVKTEWTGNNTTVTERMGTTIIARTKKIHKPDENEIEVRRFTEENESKALVTTTTYKPTGADSGGRPLLVVHPDGTATKYTYDRNPENDPECDPANNKTTMSRGALANGDITHGTRTMTITNPQGQVIEEKTTDIATATGIVLAHTKGVLPDGHGRPTYIHHFPDGQGGFAYQEHRAYSCCGLVSETDRHGVTTLHAYDALKRRVRTNRLNVTTETHYKGLVTETYRYHDVVTGPFTSTLGGTSYQLIARETRNLSGTLFESETPSPTSTNAGTLVLSRKIETEYAPAAGISRRVTTTVPGNHSQIEDFDLAGRLVKSTGALSPAMEYAYTATATGLLSARAYIDGANHREIAGTQTDWAGRTTATGRLASLTSGTLVDYTEFDYSPTTGQLLSVTDADLVTTLYAYNAKGERTTSAMKLDEEDEITYGTDQITRTETKPALRQVGTDPATEEPIFVSVTRTETKVWQDATQQHPNGIETLVSYSERTPDGLKSWSWQIGYGETHHITTAGLSRIETTTRPDNTYTRNTYSGGMLHNVEFFDSGHNSIVSTTYGYDDLKRLETTLDSRTGPNATITTYLSATADFVASVTDAGSRQTLYAYDSRGRRTTVTLPNTTESHTTYTPRGEVEARWGSQTYPEFRTYDYAGRLKTLRTKPNFHPIDDIPVNTGGSLTTWNHYTATGLLWEKLDHLGKGPEYTYTAAGRLQTRQWARGRLTVYAYTHGLLTGVAYYGTDALWQDYLAKRDVWLALLDDQTASQKEIDDAKDEMNAARAANDAAPDISTPNLGYTHDTLGRIRTVTRGGNNHAEYGYDTNTLLLKTEKLNLDTNPRHLHRHYGDHGRPLSLDLATTAGASQYTTGYGYDIAGRLKHVWHHPSLHSTTKAPTGDPTFTYGYTYTQAHPGDLRVGATSGQNLKQDLMPYTVTRHAADPNHVLTATRTYEGTRDALRTIENKAGTGVVSSYTYAVNLIGQRESVTTNGSAFGIGQDFIPADWAWDYDSLGQLDFAEHGATQASHRVYEYDLIGNRKKSAHGTLDLPANDNYQSNALNQYEEVPDFAPQPGFDFDGNMTSGPVPGTSGNTPGIQAPANATNLQWDAENRLISATVANIGTITYQYDHLSRLIRRQLGQSSPAHYYYDGWNRIADFVFTSTNRTYTWGLDLSGTPQGAGGVGGLLATRHGSSTYPSYYTFYDGNGNVTEYMTATGGLSVHYEYDPFGTLTRLTGSTYFAYRFSTKPRDISTGLYYYGYRYYDPVTGRWTSRDPIEELGGVNLYGFVGNDGANKWDLLGMQTKSICKCGPDITESLRNTLKAIGDAFRKLPNEDRDNVCSSFVDLAQWDILDLKARNYTRQCGEREKSNTPSCQRTVTLQGGCYYIGSVNYILYGRMFRLCEKSRAWRRATIFAYKGIPFVNRSNNYSISQNFARVGNNNWNPPLSRRARIALEPAFNDSWEDADPDVSNVDLPRPDRQHCKICKHKENKVLRGHAGGLRW